MLNENMINNSISPSNNELNLTNLNNEKMSNDQLINQSSNQQFNSIQFDTLSNETNNISIQFDESNPTDKLIFNTDDLIPKNIIPTFTNRQLISNIELSEPNIKIFEPNIELSEPNINFESTSFLDDNLNNDTQPNIQDILLDNNNNKNQQSNSHQINNLDKNEQEFDLQNDQNNDNILNSNQQSDIKDDSNKRALEESTIEDNEVLTGAQENLSKKIKLMSTTNLAANSTTNSLSIPVASVVPLNSMIPKNSLLPTTSANINNFEILLSPKIQQKMFSIPNSTLSSAINPTKSESDTIDKMKTIENKLNFLNTHLQNLEVKQLSHECNIKLIEKNFIKGDHSNAQMKSFYDEKKTNSLMNNQFKILKQTMSNLGKDFSKIRNDLNSFSYNKYPTATRRINCVNGILSKNCTDYADKLIKGDQERSNDFKKMEYLNLSNLNNLTNLDNLNRSSNKSINSNNLVFRNNLIRNKLVVVNYENSDTDSLTICDQINSSKSSTAENGSNRFKLKEFEIKLIRITVCPICKSKLDKTHRCNLN